MSKRGHPVPVGPAELIRPRFFAGQLLTDEDLSVLQDWIQARLRLIRYREGWGVVCGLAVNADVKNPGKLTVTSGYAVDCQGHDIVLHSGGFADIPQPDSRGSGGCPYPARPSDRKGTVVVGPYTLKQSEVVVFDLMLVYHEVDTTPVAALNAKGAAHCEDTRTRERGKLEFVQRSLDDVLGTDSSTPKPPEDPAIALLKAFKSDETVGSLFDLDKVGTTLSVKPETVKDWFTKQFQANADLSRRFPTLIDSLQTGKDVSLATPWRVAELLFWLTSSLRQSTAQCTSCEECRGVKLARLWTEWKEGAYRIRFVDDMPPARRPFGKDGQESWKTATYLGHPWLDVYRKLKSLGISPTQEVFEIPADGSHLLRLYEAENKMDPSTDNLVALTAQKQQSGEENNVIQPNANRVVGFRTGKAGKPLLSTKFTAGIKLYKLADPPAEMKPIWTDPLAPTDEISYSAIPVDGWVRLAFILSGFEPEDPPTGPFWFYNSIQRKLVTVDGTWANGKVVSTTFKVETQPKDLPIENVEISLIVKHAGSDRVVAIQRNLGGVGVGLHPLTQEQLSSWTADANLDSTLSDRGKNRSVVIFGDAKALVKIWPSNPTISTLFGEIHYGYTPPTKEQLKAPETLAREFQWARGDSASSAAGVVPDPEFITLAKAKANKAGYIWLANLKDGFGRTVDVQSPTQPTLQLIQANIKVEVKTNAGTSSLELTNEEDNEVTNAEAAIRKGGKAASTDWINIADNITLKKRSTGAEASRSVSLAGLPAELKGECQVRVKYKRANAESQTGYLAVDVP